MQVEYMPCKAEHFRHISLQEHDVMHLAAHLSDDFARVLETEFALSAWANFRCIGAAGLVGMWPGTALAWAIVSKDAGPYLKPITKKVRSVIQASPFKRIEMRTDVNFKQGNQWARLLGFTLEAPLMRKSGSLGEDQCLYSMVR